MLGRRGRHVAAALSEASRKVPHKRRVGFGVSDRRTMGNMLIQSSRWPS